MIFNKELINKDTKENKKRREAVLQAFLNNENCDHLRYVELVAIDYVLTHCWSPVRNDKLLKMSAEELQRLFDEVTSR